MPVVYDNYVKKPHQEIEYTQEQIQELAKCANNIFHFCKYVKIVHPDKGRVRFDPYDFQEEIINKYLNHRFLILLLARQVGKSTTVGVIACWYAMFNKDKIIGITSYIEKEAINILDKIKIIYEELPDWLKPGVKEYNKKSILFENGTKIQVSATTKNAFRGRTLNLLICDELAFVQPNQAEDFWSSNFPTISKSVESKVILISTPKGQHNLFHRLWLGALKDAKEHGKPGKNGFVAIKHNWRCLPERDDEWARRERESLGSDMLFKQEHECDFIGSNSTVIDPEVIKSLYYKYINPQLYDLGKSFRIYEKPKNKYEYVIGVDVGKGTGENFSTIQVLKINSTNPINLEQVAVYENNKIDVYSFAEVVNKISLYYNRAYIMAENNAEGSTIVSELHWNYENSGLINSGNKNKDLGIRASKKSKPIAVILMKKLIEDGMLKINDYGTVNQLSDFTDVGRGIYRCENLNDDLVSALYWAVYIFNMNILSEDYSFKKNEEDEDVAWGLLSDVGDNIEEDWSWVIM